MNTTNKISLAALVVAIITGVATYGQWLFPKEAIEPSGNLETLNTNNFEDQTPDVARVADVKSDNSTDKSTPLVMAQPLETRLDTFPEQLRGVWKGLSQRSDYPSPWSTIFTLVGGELNTVVGVSAYPSLACGGPLTLLSVNQNSIKLNQKITYGSCLDGPIVVHIESNDLMKIESYSVDYSIKAEGILDRVSIKNDEDSVLLHLVDIWTGSGQQSNKTMWSVLYAITTGQVNSIVGTSAYPSLACGGELRLLEIEGDQIKLYEEIKYGNCLTNQVIIQFETDSIISIDWLDTNSQIGAEGKLSRWVND